MRNFAQLKGDFPLSHTFINISILRDLQLLGIRPELQLDTTASTPAELFQNQTLRQILKFQHELLVAGFRSYIRKRHGVYKALSEKGRQDWIANSLQKDQQLRQLMAGMVIGQFTIGEWEEFAANEAEYLRRLISMMVQRLQSVANDLG